MQQHSRQLIVIVMVNDDQENTMHYCNLLCYVKCLTSLLTIKVVAMSLYHIVMLNADQEDMMHCGGTPSCGSQVESI